MPDVPPPTNIPPADSLEVPDADVFFSPSPSHLSAWKGQPCVTISTIVPTRYNPAPGQERGPLIPRWRVEAVRSEFFAVVRNGQFERVQQLVNAPALTLPAGGIWTDDDDISTTPHTYLDPDALRLMANVDLPQAFQAWSAVIRKAAHWVEELDQVAWYLELHGHGLDRHHLVRRHHRETLRDI